MRPIATQSGDASPGRPGRVARRAVLAGGAAALAGCSAFGGNDGRGSAGAEGIGYDRSDLALSLGVWCYDSTRRQVRVDFSWRWRGDGGSAPDDVAAIYWDADKWRLVEPDENTSDTVEFEGPFENDGIRGVRYRHDDDAAESGTSYMASCRLEPSGEFDPETRNVFGSFAHVREELSGTAGDGTFGDVDQAWKESVETDEAALETCGDGEP